MKYLQLQQDCYSLLEYEIRSLREHEMQAIKQWRNEQMAVLRQSRILTDEDQRSYYHEIVLPSYNVEHPKLMLFSYYYDGRHIGYGGLTNLDWVNRRAEISYLVETERSSEEDVVQYTSDFSTFLNLMKHIAFEELDLHRLFTETFDIRPLHIQILESSGFQFEGRMKEHVRIDDRYVDSLLHGCLTPVR